MVPETFGPSGKGTEEWRVARRGCLVQDVVVAPGSWLLAPMRSGHVTLIFFANVHGHVFH